MTPTRAQIAAEPLLTPDEEVDLALRIEAGLLAQERRLAFEADPGADLGAEERADPGADPSTGPSGEASLAELRTLEAEGVASKQRLVRANLRLVAMVSGPAAARTRLPDGDLFQEGCLGLLQAVERYDYRRGSRFATYGLVWIRSYVGAATANRCGAVNLPTGRAERIRAVRGLEGLLTQELGRSVTAADLAARLGCTIGYVTHLLSHQIPQSVDGTQLAALELPAVDDDDEGDLVGMTAELLARLSPLHRSVLEKRCGFGSGKVWTYPEVAVALGIGATTVRRLEQRALDELRGVCTMSALAHL